MVHKSRGPVGSTITVCLAPADATTMAFESARIMSVALVSAHLAREMHYWRETLRIVRALMSMRLAWRRAHVVCIVAVGVCSAALLL